MPCRPFILTWIACAASAAAPAVAQFDPGDGRLLDNNPQIGSGGVNLPQYVPDYSARNLIITGNVPGLGYFRDEVGYGAPGEFLGGAGSDDLFRFRARSLSSTYAAPGRTVVLGDFHQVVAGTADAVYRSYASVRSADFSRASQSALLLSPRGAAYRAFAPTTTLNRQVRVLEPQSTAFGVVTQPDGRLLELNASPLLGVRQRELRGPNTDPLDSAPLLKPQPLEQSGTTPSPGAAQLTPTTTGVPASLVIGQQIHAAVIGGSDASNDALGQRTTQLASALFSPESESAVALQDNVYAGLLRQAREQSADAAAPGDQPAPPTRPAGAPALAAPTPKQLADADAERRSAMLAVRGVQPDDTPDDAPDTDEVPLPTQLAGLVDKLDYDLPALHSLAGRRDTPINKTLRQAEADLRAGRYFSAEKQYRFLLAIEAKQTMARVGLVHAQLGAGLVRTAAFNLRRLFDDHPQLIAARYQADLLPKPQRLARLRDELQALIDQSPRPEAALLLAYLGYQTGSDELVRYGLDAAQARSPRDPLAHLLRRIWLDQPTPSRPQPKDK